MGRQDILEKEKYQLYKNGKKNKSVTWEFHIELK